MVSIGFFAEYTCASIDEYQTMMWVSAVSWCCPHPAKIWFGQPTQTWSTETQPRYSFIPIPNMRSRVVYAKAIVNFGTTGCRTVNIIVPLHLYVMTSMKMTTVVLSLLLNSRLHNILCVQSELQYNLQK